MSGRIRSIKPEILEDEKVATLSHLEFRLFVGSWLLADDYGNLRADPNYIRGQIVWASQNSREDVAKALGTLARLSLLDPYRVRGQSYLHIRGWEKHQRVDKPGKPRMPGPDDPEAQTFHWVTDDSQDPRENPANILGSLAPDLRPPTSDQDHDHEGDRGNNRMASPVGDFALGSGSESQSPAKRRKRARGTVPADLTETERVGAGLVLEKLGAQNGVKYTACDAHVGLIVRHLRDGATVEDLRAVIGYCALELNWKNKPNMTPYLRPETLFGPETIAKYLDPARTWWATLPDDTPRINGHSPEAEAEPGWMRKADS